MHSNPAYWCKELQGISAKKLELICAAVTNSSTFEQQYGMYMVKQY